MGKTTLTKSDDTAAKPKPTIRKPVKVTRHTHYRTGKPIEPAVYLPEIGPNRKPTVARGSRNVFADLGFAEPVMELKKAELAVMINDLLKAKKLTQAKAGELLGMPQPQVSLLSRGILGGFTIDRLISMLHSLDHDVSFRFHKLPAKAD
ncbi:MAG: helix-turn-helix domain-containing protein [Fimbriiglobus sp.]